MEPFDLSLWPGWNDAAADPIESIVEAIEVDSRLIAHPNSLFVALRGAKSDGHQFLRSCKSRLALVRKHTPPIEGITLLRVDDPLRALQEIAEAYRKWLEVPLLAITGTFGKTLTKKLLIQLLKGLDAHASPDSFNSQLGVPLSLLSLDRSMALGLIEVGFSKPGELHTLGQLLRPEYALVTSSDPSSALEPFLSIDEEIESFLQSVSNWSLTSSSLPLVFETSPEEARIELPSMPPLNLSLPSSHHGKALNLALLAAIKLGISSRELHSLLPSLIFAHQEKEEWISPNQVKLLNGPGGSHSLSLGKALIELEGEKTSSLVLEPSESLSPSFLSEKILEHHISSVSLVGSHPKLERALKTNSNAKVLSSPTIQSAVLNLLERATPGESILIQTLEKHSLENLAPIPGTNRLIIDLGQIRRNLLFLKQKLPKKHALMGMVKAHAYGTDPVQMGRFLLSCGVKFLGVAYLDEALKLLRGGVVGDIFVMHIAPHEIPRALWPSLILSVSDLKTARRLSKEAVYQGKSVRVHLHIDTGMSRFGCSPGDAPQLALQLVQLEGLHFEGIWTHFAASEDPSQDEFTKQQIDRFRRIFDELKRERLCPRWVHAANSMGHLRFPLPFCNLSRIGLALYASLGEGLCDALTLQSRLVDIKACKKGESVSYGRTYKVKRDEERIGVVPLGYFDGIHRHYSGRGYLLIHGKKAFLRGRICMDYLMVDLTDIPQAKVGDPVLVFGGNGTLPLATFASWGETDIRELITCLGPRIERLFIDAEK